MENLFFHFYFLNNNISLSIQVPVVKSYTNVKNMVVRPGSGGRILCSLLGQAFIPTLGQSLKLSFITFTDVIESTG